MPGSRPLPHRRAALASILCLFRKHRLDLARGAFSDSHNGISFGRRTHICHNSGKLAVAETDVKLHEITGNQRAEVGSLRRALPTEDSVSHRREASTLTGGGSDSTFLSHISRMEGRVWRSRS
jgi:hypothetical protein